MLPSIRLPNMETMPHPLCIHKEHPSLPGHFPGNPMAPGVVLLNLIFSEIAMQKPTRVVTGIKKLKFIRPLLPGDCFNVQFSAEKNNTLRFHCTHNEQIFVEGNLYLKPLDQP